MESLTLAFRAFKQLQARGSISPEAVHHIERIVEAIEVLEKSADELVRISIESTFQLEV
jgi:hypothetical protein